MGVYFGDRSQSAENQIWNHLDRMRNAGPVADYYLAAHERQAWAIATGRSARSGTSMTAVTATACRRWIGTRLRTVGRWLERTSPIQAVDDDRFMTVHAAWRAKA